MATQTIKRALQTVTADFAGIITPGFVTEVADKFYLPIGFDDFVAPNQVITTTNAVSAATKLVNTAVGKFNDVRVGDQVVSLSAGTLTAKADITRTCNTFTGLKKVVYASTFTSSTIGVKAGDPVTGTGIPANTVVDRIDYAQRTIYLDKNATADGSVVLTFSPPVRVTAVRKSTATANANEIDIDSTVATAGTSVSVTIKPGAREAVTAVLRIEPVSNTTGARANYNVSVSVLDGLEVKGSDSGFNGLDFTTLNYINLGSYGFDADAFLVTARIPRPTA